MAVRKLDDLVAFQLAVDFKLRVYELVRTHPAAQRDFRYRGQLFDAASSVEANIAEGWRRFVAGEMCQFLRYGLASLEEAKRWVRDGVHRGYFTDEDCRDVLTLGDRCGASTMALWKSLQPFTRQHQGPTVQGTKSPKGKDRRQDP